MGRGRHKAWDVLHPPVSWHSSQARHKQTLLGSPGSCRAEVHVARWAAEQHPEWVWGMLHGMGCGLSPLTGQAMCWLCPCSSRHPRCPKDGRGWGWRRGPSERRSILTLLLGIIKITQLLHLRLSIIPTFCRRPRLACGTITWHGQTCGIIFPFSRQWEGL